jgi:hypothetical protein
MNLNENFCRNETYLRAISIKTNNFVYAIFSLYRWRMGLKPKTWDHELIGEPIHLPSTGQG